MKIAGYLSLLLTSLLLEPTQGSTTTTLSGGVLSYSIDIGLLTQGNDVDPVYAAALNPSSGDLEVVGPTVWPGGSTAAISHSFGFNPTKVVTFGITQGVPGAPAGSGWDKDHIVVGVDAAWALSARGNKWSVMFPNDVASFGQRMRHSLFVNAIREYAAGTISPTDGMFLFAYLKDMLLAEAGFDPNVGFRPVRFSTGALDGTVFEDVNGNGVFDLGIDQVFPGVTLTFTGPVTVSRTTTAAGNYGSFSTVFGNYTVTFSGIPSFCVLSSGSNPLSFTSSSSTEDYGFTCNRPDTKAPKSPKTATKAPSGSSKVPKSSKTPFSRRLRNTVPPEE